MAGEAPFDFHQHRRWGSDPADEAQLGGSIVVPPDGRVPVAHIPDDPSGVSPPVDLLSGSEGQAAWRGQGGAQMSKLRRSVLVAGSVVALLAMAVPASATTAPSGDRLIGNGANGPGGAIEPAYDYNTGNLTYILTPTGAPFPARANGHAVAPLYIVVYPASYPGWTLSCMGVPGNCPDHDGLIAGAATFLEPGVYGTNPAAVPGHDHLIGLANTGGDWNVAWHVYVILFTNSAAANTHITTLTQLQDALGGGDAISVDSGIIFDCSAVPASLYWSGTPI